MSTLARVRLKTPAQPSANLRAQIISSFGDPLVAAHRWNHLLSRGHTDSVNLTCEWQRNWWTHFGGGRLFLVVVEDQSEPVCIAPLFVEQGMVFNICPEDQLDLVGQVMGPEVIEAVLRAVLEGVPNFQGMKLYFVPDTSPTSLYLEKAAKRLGLSCFRENCLAAPRLDLAKQPEFAARCTRKKSLIRHENYFHRSGSLEVLHSSNAGEICLQLDEFFAQHIARRQGTSQQSLFVDPIQRDYYRDVVANIGPMGWLRFTRVKWNGRAIAFHFGLSYRGRFLFGVPTFDIELQRHSPGEVLLRQLLLAAIQDGATVFDFGPGEEPYKYRFATSEVRLVTWGIYPASASSPKAGP
jgi:CelD/BcsL family acetyltransferase involved in cellulose biosynthesis